MYTFTFSISFVVFVSATLLLSEKKLQVEADECNKNLDCRGSINKYCCRQKDGYQTRVCRPSCVGQFCSYHTDCGGPSECCSSSEHCITSTCDQCYSNSDCGFSEYCCMKRYFNQTNVCVAGGCVGQPCYWDGDCGGPGECCNSTNYCAESNCDKCFSNSDCDYNYYCCKQPNVCVYGGCVGQPCSSDSDCGGPDECCSPSNYCSKTSCDECSSMNCNITNNYYCCTQRYSYQSSVCRYGDCVGQPCQWDSDCGGPDECCTSSNYCKSDCSKDKDLASLASWLTAVIVVSVLIAVVILIAIVVRSVYRGKASARNGRTQQGELRNQPTGSTLVTLQNTRTVENNPSQFQNYPPPPYFESYIVPPQELLSELSQDLPPVYTE